MRVSILIPCYNAERWIATAIESALAQDHEDKEIIVIDDGSTDGSWSIIERYRNQIRSESTENRGSNVARNRLLALSSGEWIQYLDADDYLLPSKISAQFCALSEERGTDVLLGPTMVWREVDGREVVTKRLLPEYRDCWRALLSFSLPQLGAFLWNKRALLDVGGWDERQAVCQDDDLYLRLLMAGKKFSFSDCSGGVYREWSEDTLCRRNPSRTYRERLRILDRAESYLRATNQLSDALLDTINLSRLVCARILWHFDRTSSRTAVARIKETARPIRSGPDTIPLVYLVLYQLFGFPISERLASVARSCGFGWLRALRRR